MFRTPQHLQKGDTIAIVSPAKSIDQSIIEFAADTLKKEGFNVIVGANSTNQHHYFSGTIGERLMDFQEAINNPDVKAILCARGGYGCVQLVDRIDWAAQLRHPKWIVGFSDVTVFHQRMQTHEIASIHGTMPLNFEANSAAALTTLFQSLQGKQQAIQCDYHSHNKCGEATGTLVGGNLSILYSLLGTDDQIDYRNTILFIEDLAEQIYHVDRMFHAFSKGGILDKIKGLVIGGMTDLKDTAIPFGMSYEEVILSHFEFNKLPICFGFPAGHIDDNRALILGASVQLTVSKDQTVLSYL